MMKSIVYTTTTINVWNSFIVRVITFGKLLTCIQLFVLLSSSIRSCTSSVSSSSSSSSSSNNNDNAQQTTTIFVQCFSTCYICTTSTYIHRYRNQQQIQQLQEIENRFETSIISMKRPLSFMPKQHQHHQQQQQSTISLLFASTGGSIVDDENDTDNIMQDDTNNNNNNIMDCEIRDSNEIIKKELLSYGASYDRGYGASPRIRQYVINNLIQQLELLNPSINPTNSIFTSTSTSTSTTSKDYNYSLQYNWRMVWTSAIDVLGLNASPFFTVGAIYQCFNTQQSQSSLDDSNTNNKKIIITNIIDLLPRIQSLIPPSILPNTQIRLSVQTCASESTSTISSTNNNNNRIGLVFESVQIEPIEIFGQTISIFPPLKIDLPQVSLPSFLLEKLDGRITSSSSTTRSNNGAAQAQGYFDVTYLDDDMLIIRQNTGIQNNLNNNNNNVMGIQDTVSGLFVLTKVKSIDP